MSAQVSGMMGAGVAALVAGLILVRVRFREASSVGRALVLRPVFEATALTVFAAEHFLTSHKWLHEESQGRAERMCTVVRRPPFIASSAATSDTAFRSAWTGR